MKNIKNNIIYGLIIIAMSSFSQCDSKNLQAQSPVELGDVYCQSWIAGVEGGGGGINIFIPTTDTSVKFEQVYFRGKIATLESRDGMYIGRFKSEVNQPKEILLEGAKKQETVKEAQEEIPFEINNNQCVVAYKDGSKTKYFMIDNITEKQSLALPSAPPSGDVKIKNL